MGGGGYASLVATLHFFINVECILALAGYRSHFSASFLTSCQVWNRLSFD